MAGCVYVLVSYFVCEFLPCSIYNLRRARKFVSALVPEVFLTIPLWDLVGPVLVLLLPWLISLYCTGIFEILAAVILAVYVLWDVTSC
jgi:hypothetical protein